MTNQYLTTDARGTQHGVDQATVLIRIDEADTAESLDSQLGQFRLEAALEPLRKLQESVASAVEPLREVSSVLEPLWKLQEGDESLPEPLWKLYAAGVLWLEALRKLYKDLLVLEALRKLAEAALPAKERTYRRLVEAVHDDTPDGDRALDKLVRNYFPPTFLYGGPLRKRWEAVVEPRLERAAAKRGLPAKWVWHEVAKSAVGTALAECRGVPPHEHRIAVAKRARRYIEEELGVSDKCYEVPPHKLAPPEVNDPLSRAVERVDLEMALAQLDECERTIVTMRADGYTLAEIAARVGLSMDAVRRRWLRARGKLAVSLG